MTDKPISEYERGFIDGLAYARRTIDHFEVRGHDENQIVVPESPRSLLGRLSEVLRCAMRREGP